MNDFETYRELKIKIEIMGYTPFTPRTKWEPAEAEDVEYNAYFVVPTNGPDILTEISEDVCEELDLKKEIIEYLRDREDCMRGRDLYEEHEEYMQHRAFYKFM